MEIARLDTADAGFAERLAALTAWSEERDRGVEDGVRAIVAAVRERGDAALLDYSAQLDGLRVTSVAELEVSAAEMNAALERIPVAQRRALETAAVRIRDYHSRQSQPSWDYEDADGTLLGQQVSPLERAGIYVPGGKAAYPSSVLMNALPARVAGVEQVIMVVPAPGGERNDLVLAAAAIAGVDRLFTLGGAHAVAALAYGTETIPAVDKIVGPGNRWVAEAKRQVFGTVGIDMIAGPSEIMVVADGDNNPDWIAMDLFSQAEHDEDARATLVSPDSGFLDRVAESMERLVSELEREAIIRTAMARRGALIRVRDLDEAMEVVNRVAPEHLELALEDAREWASRVRHAGAIFLGRYTPEAFGDYCAGPNHVLPTSATARFSSPLGVYDFQKRSSLIGCSARGAAALAQTASVLARGEGLGAHARSAEYRAGEETEKGSESEEP